MAETAIPSLPRLEVGLACDAGSSSAGIYGLGDLFKYANDVAAKGRAEGDLPPVRISHWLSDDASDEVRCTYDSAPGAPHAPSVLVIPGNERATLETKADAPLVRWLRQKHAQGTVLAAVCGGVFVLARTGLLAGRHATTHWALTDQFARQFPDVFIESDRMVIDYGDVVTAGGVLAWADLGLRLVERFLGPAVMMATARYMLVDPPGREQRFYSDFEPRTTHGDDAVLKAQLLLATQRERAVSVAELADCACLEPRTFLRRFLNATGMRPSEYQQSLRISRAREMLEFSRRSINEIASAVGYEDVGGFRRVFQKIMGLTPSDYRRRFGVTQAVPRETPADDLRVSSMPQSPARSFSASHAAEGG
ncbi:GlxA family transcriptional regulator [Variovorax sp. GT1P44]|uniref:GlxA family transcriptional regulator n=1 Tax=Variovorax sp. GT1P44 TaxID=3443742 RepID=UPI003F470727